MSAFNPTVEEIEQAASETKFGKNLSVEDRATFVRDLARVGEKLPSPPKAALIGAGIGGAVALLAGRSVLKYGLIFGGLGYMGMSLFDMTFIGGYAMGFDAGAKKRA